ncbi:chemotaxis protein CheW [Thermoplasmatales archaeon ex4572_165]|nr:MAG: chemotaxis protein CheW [Thermoplasmatales archaeon ex4572_165]RLF57659.1 MAG: chemotaxis protein CheW [Thermoplasmata archaeon]
MTSGVKNEEKVNGDDTFGEQQLVIFKVAGEEFGVNINEVKEIIRWEEVTRIPNSEAYIKGVINLRGNIIVVNDLAVKLGLPSKTIDDDTRILVVEVGENTVGMIVDSATEVIRLSGDDIRETPSLITSTIDHDFIEGVGLLDEKRLLTLLDLRQVLESEDFEKILQNQRNVEQNIQNTKDIKEGEGKTKTNKKYKDKQELE